MRRNPCRGWRLLAPILIILSCKSNFSTAEFLDAQFVTSFKLYMSVPGDVIYDGKEFDMKLEAKPTATSQPLKGINGKITWTLSGTGTLTLLSCPDMVEGLQICKMRYVGGLSAGQSKVVQLKAVHDTSQEFVLDGFTVATASFSISIPSRVNVGTAFNATISALDAFGNVNTRYTGTAVLHLSRISGRPSVEEVSTFNNGTATIQLKIFKPAWEMQVIAYDKQFPVYTGTSNTFRVIQNDANYLGLDLVSVPFTATSNRLTWTTIDVANQYKIYRKDASGNYQLIHTVTSPSATTSIYEDTGLSTGTNYFYKIEAVDGGGAVLSIDYADSAPKACTSFGTSINLYTVWTKASSPYCVGALTIASALIIEPGVVVLIAPSSTWVVNHQIQAIGTPRERIIFTLNSNLHIVASGGVNVSNPLQSVIDGSYNYVSGSGFRNVVWEYFGGAYWQKPMYYSSVIFRYSSGAVFENIPSNLTLAAVLDGVTYARNSGAIQLFHPQTAIVNNGIFFRNSSVVGALHAKYDGTGTMDTQIKGNYFALNTGQNQTGASGCGTNAATGGAITADPQSNCGGSTSGTLQIVDNQFFQNSSQSAGHNGGAVRLNLKGTPTYQISNNTFSGNSAVNGGAVSFDVASAGSTGPVTGLTFTRNYFANNTASAAGGGAYFATPATANNLTVTGNYFSGNTAAANGGAIAFAGGAATNVNLGSNFFASNTATSGSGGALYFSSISTTGFSASNNHFSGNTAPGATGSRNIFNNTAASLSFLNAYFEGSTYATCDAARATNLGIADQCSGTGTNTTTITGVTATAFTLPALCINDPTVSGCVGAR